MRVTLSWRSGKRASFLILLPVLLFMGCLDYEETLQLRADGSGTLTISYEVEKEVHIDDQRFPTDPDKIPQVIKDSYTSKHVKLLELHSDRINDRTRVHFALAFRRITDLNDLKAFREEKFSLDKEDHSRKFTRQINLGEEDWNESDSQFEAWVKSLLESHLLRKIKFRFEIQVPGKIVDTNADIVKTDKRAVWHFRMSDLVSQEKVALRLTYR